MQYKIISIKTITTERMGHLSFFEANDTFNFPIQRIYYIHGVQKGVQRGAHAHKKLRQLLFCPYGEILIRLDDGKCQEEILLDDPSKGLILYPGLWRDMLWKKDDSILCVAASEHYDPADYIRDYTQFLSFVYQKEG